VEQVMVVVPVDPEVDETQYVTEKRGLEWKQIGHARPRRHLEVEHHDGDDDRDELCADESSTAGGQPQVREHLARRASIVTLVGEEMLRP
jgi:hypothetical protein